MKTIVIDGEVLCEPKMDGIHRYMISILSRLDVLMEESDIEIHIIHRDSHVIQNIKFNNIKDVGLDCKKKKYRVKAIPDYIKSVNGIYCSMSNDIAFCKKSIFTIMDLIPLYKETKYPLKTSLRMRYYYHLMKKNGQRIVTISNESKKDIVNKLKINASKIEVISCGYEHINEICEDENIFIKYPGIKKGNYYYALGSQYPHKNYKWVTEVAKRNSDSMFVVAGKMTNIDTKLLPNNNNFIYVGYISDEESKALMKNAKAFIQPSFLEGFGLPPLEALAIGVPAIVSNASCLPEIFEDAVHYIDPYDYEINLDELLSKEVSSSEKILSKYKWDKAAKQWLGLFKEAAES